MTILPIATKGNKFGKWFPSWEGPYRIVKVCSGNSYVVETLRGQRLPRTFHGDTWKSFIQVFGNTLDRLWPIYNKKSPLDQKNGRWSVTSTLELFLDSKLY
jgi:hypothetical protein